MIYTPPKDVIHKSYLNKLLVEIVDDPVLSQSLYFKGGTCAAMLGFLDRFSVDLDFDIKVGSDEKALDKRFREVFTKLGLIVESRSKNYLIYHLKYPSAPGKRNSLELDALNFVVKSNVYKPQYIVDINRIVNCQTLETMFANKLVAITDRYQRYKKVAGRDLYDVYYFFVQGYSYLPSVIEERTKMPAKKYIEELIKFIPNKVNLTEINEDLNLLLPNHSFQDVRKLLILQVVSMLKDELQR